MLVSLFSLFCCLAITSTAVLLCDDALSLSPFLVYKHIWDWDVIASFSLIFCSEATIPFRFDGKMASGGMRLNRDFAEQKFVGWDFLRCLHTIMWMICVYIWKNKWKTYHIYFGAEVESKKRRSKTEDRAIKWDKRVRVSSLCISIEMPFHRNWMDVSGKSIKWKAEMANKQAGQAVKTAEKNGIGKNGKDSTIVCWQGTHCILAFLSSIRICLFLLRSWSWLHSTPLIRFTQVMRCVCK